MKPSSKLVCDRHTNRKVIAYKPCAYTLRVNKYVVDCMILVEKVCKVSKVYKLELTKHITPHTNGEPFLKQSSSHS